MSHDSCPTILTQSVAQCAQICADGGATIKQSPRLMSLSQSADVDARTHALVVFVVLVVLVVVAQFSSASSELSSRANVMRDGAAFALPFFLSGRASSASARGRFFP